ncbi:MAG: apolipoprotein N-acyltransferase, partial [Schaalia georgiae]|nr:apolipoprotein N-acyltransferase [Schaalia georgiae]
MRDEEAQWRGAGAGAPRALGAMAVCAAAGFALYLAFPPVGWWWTAVPALAVLVACVDRARMGRALLNTTAFGVAFWTPLIPWVVVSTRTPLAWVALVVSQVLFLSLWSLSVSLMRVWSWTRSPVGQALGCALAWTGVEQARSAFPWSGFPWGTVALPQVDSPLGRLAPYGGVALVSFAVMAVAVLV